MKSKIERESIVTNAIVPWNEQQMRSIGSAMTTDQQQALRALGISLG